MTTLTHAAIYGDAGLNVIPLLPRDKRPDLTAWAVYQQRRSTPDEWGLWWPGTTPTERNLGIVTGSISDNLIVVDLDSEDAILAVGDSAPWLLETAKVWTGRGVHLYLRSDVQPGPTFSLSLPGSDGVHHIKADGGYVVAPPSIHPTGRLYEWGTGGFDPALITKVTLEELVKALEHSGFVRVSKAADDLPQGFWDEFVSSHYTTGGRADALTKLCGILRSAIGSPGIAYELLWCWNLQHLSPPLKEAEVRHTVRSLYSRYRD